MVSPTPARGSGCRQPDTYLAWIPSASNPASVRWVKSWHTPSRWWNASTAEVHAPVAPGT